MKVKSLSSVKLINNFVLIKPDPSNDQIRLQSGLTLFVNTSFQREQHAVTAGTVMKIPAELVYSKQRSHSTLDYITTQELCVGDKVIFHFNQTMTCLKEERLIEIGEEIYFLIKYDAIYCAQRPMAFHNDHTTVVPVNGVVIVEPDEEEFVSKLIFIPDYLKKKTSERYGHIRYIGTPLLGYTDFPEYGAEKSDYNYGDKILFSVLDSIPLQYEMHRLFDKDKTLYRMRRRDILAKIVPELEMA